MSTAIDGRIDADWERSAVAADRMAKAELLKQGLARQEAGRTAPTEELAFSLLLDEAAAPAGGRR